MNLFSGPARATTKCIYVARAFGKVPQKQQAKGEPGVGLIGINQTSTNIAEDSFHLQKMVACTALHLMLVFLCKSYQCIYITIHLLRESS